MNRRNFLSLLGFSPLFLKSSLAKAQNEFRFNLNNTDFAKKTYRKYKPNEIIVPNRIKTGDTVAFAAPASPIGLGKITKYVKFFEEQGCKILIADSIKKQNNKHKYLAGSDEMRANELNEFFENPVVKAIICGRGGYGVMRILGMLDYEILRKYPKIIMGYSDITALLTAVYNLAGIVTYHGPVASSRLTNEHIKNINFFLFSAEHPNNSITYNFPEMKILSEGLAEGKLQGGNLTLLSATFGTDYEVNLTNSLLFIEDVSILAHDFDRMMHQMIISNKLNSCSGIIFGKMKGIEKRGSFYPNRAYTILELMQQVVEKLKLPAAYNFPFGHLQSDLIFPLGLAAKLDTNRKNLTIFS